MYQKCLYLRQRSKKGQLYYFCTKQRKIVAYDCYRGCLDKEYKTQSKLKANKPLKKVNHSNKVRKATAIPTKIKKIVWERDNCRCVFCGKYVDMFFANSHYIKRSHLGLGIPQNLFTACLDCHRKYDDSPERVNMIPIARNHLMSKYDDWNEEMLVYKKYKD